MTRVFIDTAAWIALVNTRDALHLSAKKAMNELRWSDARLTTTEFVFLEVANALSSPNFRAQTIKLLDGLRALQSVQVIPVDSTLLAEGFDLYRARLDKEWSLTDCISFVVMEANNIAHAFTSDHHFEQAGFIKLL